MSKAQDFIQARINEGETRRDQIRRWVSAYNDESVSLYYRKAAGEKNVVRDVYALPPGPPPHPSLESCYDPARDQYVWPYGPKNGRENVADVYIEKSLAAGPQTIEPAPREAAATNDHPPRHIPKTHVSG